jgi:hypothetical protein
VHATLVPEFVMQEGAVDFLIVGEGEEAFVELLEALEGVNRLEKIKNLCFKKDGVVVRNPLRPPTFELDRLPFPDKELFEGEINYKDDYLIMTSRGCVYNCSYCCETHYNKLYDRKFFRRRSVESVLNELTTMKTRYCFREVMFNDSIFFTDISWLRTLLHQYRMKIGVPFRCFGRVNAFNEEVAELLKWGGCYAIEFGIQTLNESLRKGILNRPERNQDSMNAFEICDSYGIRYDLDHMFGLPEEQEEDHIFASQVYGNLRYLNRIKCHNLNYFPMLPITALANEKGILSSADVLGICAGEEGGDFFHKDSVRDHERRKSNQSYQTLFKFLPLLRPRQISFLLTHNLVRKLYLMPKPVVIFLQILVAIRGGDYRFLLYTKYYYLRIKRWVWDRLMSKMH